MLWLSKRKPITKIAFAHMWIFTARAADYDFIVMRHYHLWSELQKKLSNLKLFFSTSQIHNAHERFELWIPSVLCFKVFMNVASFSLRGKKVINRSVRELYLCLRRKILWVFSNLFRTYANYTIINHMLINICYNRATKEKYK